MTSLLFCEAFVGNQQEPENVRIYVRTIEEIDALAGYTYSRRIKNT